MLPSEAQEHGCLISALARPQQVVEPKKAIVDTDVQTAKASAAAANAIKTECEEALAEAIPILNGAIAALDTIKPADIKLVQVRGKATLWVKLRSGKTSSSSR